VSIFEELRALDDIDELRGPRFASGIPLWPLIRWFATSAALERVHGLQVPFATGRPRGARELVALVARALVKSPLLVRRSFDVVIASNSGGLVVQREGRWFDRINDYFAGELPDRTLVLDTLVHGAKQPRYVPHVRYNDAFDILAGIGARLRRPRDADLAAIESVLAAIRAHFPVALDAAALASVREQLTSWAARLPFFHDLYRRFFDRVQPRVMLIQGASHGALAHVCTWARAAGIITAEPQHGIISRSHLAYNYGTRSLADGDFARCLPQHLLVYGEFWGGQVRSASAIDVIGCPHFSETARRRRATGDNVLVVSQGICTDLMVRLTTAIAQRFPKRRCVFRVHPGELAFRERYASLAKLANVELSERGDIYDQLAAASAVVGYSSMALVEACGLGLPVFVYDDETTRAYLPRQVGTRFRSADELLGLLVLPTPADLDPNAFFAADWRERYRDFVMYCRPPS
jgi:hypothetical protein